MFGARLGEIDSFVPLAAESPATTGETGSGLSWLKNDFASAAAKARAEGKLVFVSFTGYACTNCHWMKANMFTRPEIAAALKEYVLVELYTDGTDAVSEQNQQLQERKFGTVAIPLYALDHDQKMLQSRLDWALLNTWLFCVRADETILGRSVSRGLRLRADNPRLSRQGCGRRAGFGGEGESHSKFGSHWGLHPADVSRAPYCRFCRIEAGSGLCGRLAALLGIGNPHRGVRGITSVSDQARSGDDCPLPLRGKVGGARNGRGWGFRRSESSSDV
ncbi:MAG: thioredoxin family protein [Bryobacteraceae bacterium]